jgi:hypothetical protein
LIISTSAASRHAVQESSDEQAIADQVHTARDSGREGEHGFVDALFELRIGDPAHLLEAVLDVSLGLVLVERT